MPRPFQTASKRGASAINAPPPEKNRHSFLQILSPGPFFSYGYFDYFGNSLSVTTSFSE